VKNKFAQALGKLARGVPKNYSPEERRKRSDRMKEMNRLRREASRASKRRKEA